MAIVSFSVIISLPSLRCMASRWVTFLQRRGGFMVFQNCLGSHLALLALSWRYLTMIFRLKLVVKLRWLLYFSPWVRSLVFEKVFFSLLRSLIASSKSGDIYGTCSRLTVLRFMGAWSSSTSDNNFVQAQQMPSVSSNTLATWKGILLTSSRNDSET